MAHIAIDARLINSSTGRYIERLLHYLEQIDTTNHYTVLVRIKDETYWTPSNDNFQVKIADFDNYSFAEQIGFKRLLDNLAPDLVHFCMPQQPILYKGPHVTTFHDMTLLKTYNTDKPWLSYHIKQFIGGFVFKHVARTSSRIVVPTLFTKKELIEFTSVSEEKVTVTYEAAEASSSVLEPYVSPFKRFVMYVGQQPDYKNIRRLGDAHQKLLADHPDLGLILVGKMGDDTKANQAYFEEQGYKNIHFTGFVSDGQRDWLMKHCEAYVFPSLMEGFGLPGLEAMAAGAPVVSSNASCLPEVYGDAAEYFDPTNVDDIAAAIKRVVTDKDLHERLVKAGTKQVAKYSWKRMAKQTHKIYMSALRGVSK